MFEKPLNIKKCANIGGGMSLSKKNYVMKRKDGKGVDKR